MKLLPFENFKIATNLNSFKNKQKMEDMIGPSNELYKNGKPFQGKIQETFFKIVRKTPDVHPFFPIIQGKIDDEVISFYMRLNFPALFKMCFGLCAVMIIGVIMYRRDFFLGTLCSALIIIIGYTMSLAYFKSEVKMVRSFLEKKLGNK